MELFVRLIVALISVAFLALGVFTIAGWARDGGWTPAIRRGLVELPLLPAFAVMLAVAVVPSIPTSAAVIAFALATLYYVANKLLRRVTRSAA